MVKVMRYSIFIANSFDSPTAINAESIKIIENSKQASLRLQLAQAAKASVLLGVQPIFINPARNSVKSLPDEILANVSFCYLGKVSLGGNLDGIQLLKSFIDICLRLKDSGSKLIINYTDNWCDYDAANDFDSSPEGVVGNNFLAGMYKLLIHNANTVIVACQSQKRAVLKWMPSTCTSHVILDPVESKKSNFLPLSSEEEIKLCWFGHYSNFDFLQKAIFDAVKSVETNQKIHLSIVSSVPVQVKIQEWCQSLRPRSKWIISMHEWTREVQSRILQNSHMTILPSDLQCPRKAFASHNRAVEAINQGCLTIASPLDSYQEIGECLLLGHDFGKMLSYAIENYSSEIRRVSDSRDKLLSRFSKENNIQGWKNVLKSA